MGYILIPVVFCIFAYVYSYPELGAASVVANDYLPEVEGASRYPGSGEAGLVISKALGCFSDKYIYSGCGEAQRLTRSGEINVLPEYADEYCKGPCLAETNRVLDCIDGFLKGFVFYNKATLKDVRQTIESGCGEGPKRGNFDVLQRIQAGEGSKKKALSSVVYVIGIVIIGWGLAM